MQPIPVVHVAGVPGLLSVIVGVQPGPVLGHLVLLLQAVPGQYDGGPKADLTSERHVRKTNAVHSLTIMWLAHGSKLSLAC